jgi:hypothetical protein
VAGIRLHWINNALPSKATVLYIDHTRFSHPMQAYPVVSYQTHSGEVITRGTYNLPINTGQTVGILYNPDNTQEFRLNTPYWLWYDTWSWYRMIWIAIALYYLVLFIVKRNAKRTTGNGNASKTVSGRGYSKNDDVSIETVTIKAARIDKNTKRLPIVVKGVLLLLLPVSLFFIGQIWGVPYARQIAVVVFLGLVALASPFGSATDSDLGSAPDGDL